MTDPNEPPRPVFDRPESPLRDFLWSLAKSDEEDPRFEARNFLLDEGVHEPRADTYHQHVGEDATASVGDWLGGHDAYLKARVFLDQPSNGIPRNLDPERPERCPETFRHDESFRAFGAAYKKLRLLRVVDVTPLSRHLGIPAEQIVNPGREIAAARAAGREPEAEHRQQVDAYLSLWNQDCQLRPTYVTFLADHEDLFEKQPDDDQDGWADTLRDRLGSTTSIPAPVAGVRSSCSSIR